MRKGGTNETWNEKRRGFFNDLDLAEDMSKLSKIFADNFMIAGEVTEDLKEALHRAPDSLIDTIYETIEREPGESIERKEKEFVLLSDIPESLESQLIFMKPNELMILARVMNQQPIELMDTTIVNEKFVPRGWVTAFNEDNKCTFVVTEQVRGILEKLAHEDVKNQLEFAVGIRYIINTCLRLYGVFEKEIFMDICTKIALEGQSECKCETIDILHQV